MSRASPFRRVMEAESPSKFSRSSSLPSRLRTDPVLSLARPPPATPTQPCSSITRPYRLSPSSTKGFSLSSIKPSALLQRRAHATQGLSEVQASPKEYTPVPPPPPSPKPPSAYEVLQIPPSATLQEIKAAYWRLARQHHPDKAPLDRKEASSILFLEIHAAYLALKDPEARTRYDLQMSLQSSRSSLTELRTPHFCSPSPNVFTPRSQLYTPRASVPNPYTPRSQLYTPKAATVADSSPNIFTPRTPFSTGRSWETDQCW